MDMNAVYFWLRKDKEFGQTGLENSIDPDQTSDLAEGLHYLPFLLHLYYTVKPALRDHARDSWIVLSNTGGLLAQISHLIWGSTLFAIQSVSFLYMYLHIIETTLFKIKDKYNFLGCLTGSFTVF